MKNSGFKVCFILLISFYYLFFGNITIFAIDRCQRITDRLCEAGWGQELAQDIAKNVVYSEGRLVAVFDHDGTLIHGDISEGDGKTQPGILKDIFVYNKMKEPVFSQIPERYGPPSWEAYLAWATKDPQHAYAWISTLLAGYSVFEARNLASYYYETVYKNHIFPEMITMIKVLKEENVEIYVISASAQVLVQASANYFDIYEGNIFGIRLEIEGDIIKPRVILPISFDAGKTYYIQRFIGNIPRGNILVFGDSYRTDGHMLRYSARHGGIAVLVNPKNELLKTLHRHDIRYQYFSSKKTD